MSLHFADIFALIYFKPNLQVLSVFIIPCFSFPESSLASLASLVSSNIIIPFSLTAHKTMDSLLGSKACPIKVLIVVDFIWIVYKEMEEKYTVNTIT